MAEKQTNKDRMREIVDSIENGIKELFESDKYRKYLATMSRFHRYSVNNTMLIYMQRPDATHVAGFNKWRDQFGRNVLKGEKGIRIIAPTPYKKKVEEIKTDPETNAPMLDADGKAIIEEKEIRIPMFKVVSVFDVSQTAGKPLPQLAADLSGNVQQYEVFMEALRRASPVPMEIKPVARDTDGFFSIKAQSITIRAGMSEVQTVCAAVHEIAHAKLHDYEHMTELADDGETILVPGEKSRNTEEVEAESISYHLRQSFVPGEITPEEANRLGCELAKRFTKGNHAYIVCTHIDKAHIHNHVIWNSTALSQTRKFRNFWGSSRAVRRLNDTICIENGYSIVENPKRHGKSYNKWLGDKKKPSHRERICAAIDDALAQKPDSFETLLELLRQAGYEVKGKKVPSLLGGEQKKSIRMDTLGDGYTPADLRAVIAGEKAHTPRKSAAAPVKPEKRSGNLLVDIQTKLRAGKGAGYARWATLFNLKQMAQTVAYLQDHELLDYAVLSEKAAAASAHFNELSARIKAAEKRMAEIAVLREHIANYAKTRDTYVAYRKAGYSKKFLAEHESEITIHKAAKNYFDGLGFKKLPTIKALNTEYAELLAEKKAAYADYRKAREEMKELLTAKANIDRILELDKEQEEANERREKEAEQR